MRKQIAYSALALILSMQSTFAQSVNVPSKFPMELEMNGSAVADTKEIQRLSISTLGNCKRRPNQ